MSVEVPQKKKEPPVQLGKDESIRGDTTMGGLAKIRPAFRKEGGSVTAGNACGMTDGACAIVLTTRGNAKALGKAPLFSIVSYSEVAVEPKYMGEGPGIAFPMALQTAGMKLEDMDLLEVNEAFAAQVLTDERMLKWDRSKLNVHGGAIALGHPTGISGARILITGSQALKRLGKEHLVASIRRRRLHGHGHPPRRLTPRGPAGSTPARGRGRGRGRDPRSSCRAEGKR